MSPSHRPELARFHALADAVLKTNPELGLLKVELKTYVVLERKLGTSKSNKNAVNFLPQGVDFMVPDWTYEEEARVQGFSTDRSEKYGTRLRFLRLTPEEIEAHTEFFTHLTLTAVQQAEYLQTPSRQRRH
jgi:hypothetical protein